jgi:hypothetical protein
MEMAMRVTIKHEERDRPYSSSYKAARDVTFNCIFLTIDFDSREREIIKRAGLEGRRVCECYVISSHVAGSDDNVFPKDFYAGKSVLVCEVVGLAQAIEKEKRIKGNISTFKGWIEENDKQANRTETYDL